MHHEAFEVRFANLSQYCLRLWCSHPEMMEANFLLEMSGPV